MRWWPALLLTGCYSHAYGAREDAAGDAGREEQGAVAVVEDASEARATVLPDAGAEQPPGQPESGSDARGAERDAEADAGVTDAFPDLDARDVHTVDVADDAPADSTPDAPDSADAGTDDAPACAEGCPSSLPGDNWPCCDDAGACGYGVLGAPQRCVAFSCRRDESLDARCYAEVHPLFGFGFLCGEAPAPSSSCALSEALSGAEHAVCCRTE